MKIELDRRDVCKLMLLCTAAWAVPGVQNPEWLFIHDKLAAQLKEWDEKHSKEELK